MAKYLSRFFVRKQDEQNEVATLFLRAQNKKLKVDMLFSSQLRVNVADWRRALSSPARWRRHRKGNAELHTALDRIEDVVVRLTRDLPVDKELIKAEIMAIVNPEKAEPILNAVRVRKERDNIWMFLERFCEEIKGGTRLNGNNRYSLGTVYSWFCFKKLYDRFDSEHRFVWSDIDRPFVTKFLGFMENEGYMVTAQNKYLVTLRAMVNYAYKDGVHDNLRATSCFAKKKVEESDKAAEVWLSADELQALFEMPLTGKEDEVRDIFLVGCYTCQRVSDYSRIKSEDFRRTPRGTPIIRIVQQKTRTEVKIPIMDANLRRICEKYAYNLPQIDDATINSHIKLILKRLSESVPSLGRIVTTRLTMKQKHQEALGKKSYERNSEGFVLMPRYDCVTTHTARRSGITNMYLTKKYTIVQMMYVSGHKTQKTFMDYIKLSSDEIADEIDAIANGPRADIF